MPSFSLQLGSDLRKNPTCTGLPPSPVLWAVWIISTLFVTVFAYRPLVYLDFAHFVNVLAFFLAGFLKEM